MKSLSTIELTAQDLRAFDWIDGQTDSLIALLRDWVQINSGSTHYEGLERMQEALSEAYEPIGGRLEALSMADSEIVEPDGAIASRAHPPALQLTQRPEAPIQVVLTGHYDTVFPQDSAFQDWRMLDDDRMNGPGGADMKGGLLVMAAALTAFERFCPTDAVGYTVLVSPDEEIGSPASAPVLAEIGAKAHLGMTYEPALADGSLAGARKGSGNFALVVTGRSAHAGREHAKGRNALEAVARFVVALQDLNGAHDGVTFNVGKIDGGGPVNTVPDRGVCRFNIRVQDEAGQAWALSEIDRLVAEVDARDGISARLHGGLTRPPKPMAPPNAAMFDFTKACGAALGLDVVWNDTGGVCEGNNLWAVGCPNVDTLGVRGAHIHSEDEFVMLSSLPERAKLSALMLMKIAEGVIDTRALRNL